MENGSTTEDLRSSSGHTRPRGLGQVRERTEGAASALRRSLAFNPIEPSSYTRSGVAYGARREEIPTHADENRTLVTTPGGTVAVPTVPNAPRKAKGFRLQGKRFFFTWPNLEIDSKSALDAIMGWRPVKWAMVARETHESGEHHIHAAVWLKSKCDLRTFRSLDNVFGKHGNYESMRDPVKSVQYLMKEEDFRAYGFDPKAYVKARAGRRLYSDLAKFMQEGGDPTDFEDQGVVLRSLRAIRDYRNLWVSVYPRNRRPSATGAPPICKTIVIYGESECGKSRWANTGSHRLNGHTRGLGNTTDVFILGQQRRAGLWWDGYRGERTIVLDDFQPRKVALRSLLRILDTYPYRCEVKGGMVMADWLRVIITNNDHPVTWYPLASRRLWGALERRIQIRYVKDMQWQEYSFEAFWRIHTWPLGPSTSFSSVSGNLIDPADMRY